MVTFIKYLQRFLPILVDTPDPYVKLLIKTAPNGKKQTTVKNNTANPIWDETFQFLLERELENILGKSVEFVFCHVWNTSVFYWLLFLEIRKEKKYDTREAEKLW